MALIKCPECGKEISDKAEICIGCGFPLSELNKSNNTQENSVPVGLKQIREKGYRIIRGKKRLEIYNFGVFSYLDDKKISECKLDELKILFFREPTKREKGMFTYFINGSEYIENIYFKNDSSEYFKNMIEDLNGVCQFRLRNKEDELDDIVIKDGNVYVRTNKTYTNPEFHGIYKYTLFGGKQEVYCPRCNSENCSYYTEMKTIPGKTKTRYTANLNPLHPFTLVNKKEKVVRQEQSYEEKKIICNDCGYTFY